MYTRELLGLLPRKRLHAVDGMAVTANVWEEAHEYHRLLDRLNTVLLHGAGIIAGLEVIASDPADSSVYVLPGYAVDGIGQPIVVPEPRAYDLGEAEGVLYLIITYSESRPQSTGNRVQEDGPRYVHLQYTLEAVEDLPETPYLELARVWRRDGDKPIIAAKQPLAPRENEIDLRFRREIGVTVSPPAVSIGVVTLRGAEGSRHDEGMMNVAAAMRHHGQVTAWIDRSVPLDAELSRFDLLYVVGRDAIEFSTEEMTRLHAFWQAGGVIFYESCRRDQAQGSPPADEAARGLFEAFGVQLSTLKPPHGLFTEPYLFAQPPVGFEMQGNPQLSVGEGVILSQADYGCLWRGERRGRPATRAEIRDALEWGTNLAIWSAAQRQARRAAAGMPAAAQVDT